MHKRCSRSRLPSASRSTVVAPGPKFFFNEIAGLKPAPGRISEIRTVSLLPPRRHRSIESFADKNVHEDVFL